MRILVLDDDLKRHKTFKRNLIGHERVVHVHTHDQACKALEEETFDLLFLDHDLNLEGTFRSVRRDENGIEWELTGQDVARAVTLLPETNRPKQVIVHSYNPTGARRMVEILSDAGISAYWELFSATSGQNLT